MTRYPGLMDVHALDNVAYGAFPRLHRLDDAKAGWISERLKQIYLRAHAYTFSCIYRIVKLVGRRDSYSIPPYGLRRSA